MVGIQTVQVCCKQHHERRFQVHPRGTAGTLSRQAQTCRTWKYQLNSWRQGTGTADERLPVLGPVVADAKAVSYQGSSDCHPARCPNRQVDSDEIKVPDCQDWLQPSCFVWKRLD